MTWIKTKNQLPPDLEPVLLFFKDKYSKEIFVGWWDSLNKTFTNGTVMFFNPIEEGCEKMYFKRKKIIYWRELPCMPKDEIND